MTEGELATLQRPRVRRHVAHTTAQGRRKAAAPAPLETDECRTFIAWTKLVTYLGEPLFDRVVKIPNERGKRGASIAIMVAIGMRPGFPDYDILAPAGRFHGLYLEAKREGETPKAEQTAWRDRLIRYGYHAEVCQTAIELINAVKQYFERAGCVADGSFVDGTRLSA